MFKSFQGRISAWRFSAIAKRALRCMEAFSPATQSQGTRSEEAQPGSGQGRCHADFYCLAIEALKNLNAPRLKRLRCWKSWEGNRQAESKTAANKVLPRWAVPRRTSGGRAVYPNHPTASGTRQQVSPLFVAAGDPERPSATRRAQKKRAKIGPNPSATRLAENPYPKKQRFANSSCRASAHHEMQHQRNDCKQKQKMYQSSGNMKHGKAANPRNNQDCKQYCPYTHKTSIERWKSAGHVMSAQGSLLL